MQIPQPMQRVSEIPAILSVGETSMQSCGEINLNKREFKRNLLLINYLAHSYYGAGLFAFLAAPLGFAFVSIDDGYPGELVSLLESFFPLSSHLPEISELKRLKNEGNSWFIVPDSRVSESLTGKTVI